MSDVIDLVASNRPNSNLSIDSDSTLFVDDDQNSKAQTAEIKTEKTTDIVITENEHCSKSEKSYILEPSKDRLIEQLQLQLRQKEAEGIALRQRNDDLGASRLRL